MEWPPIETDAARALNLFEPHHAQIGIRAAHGEPEVDVSRHRNTSSVKEWRIALPKTRSLWGHFSTLRLVGAMSDLSRSGITSQTRPQK